MGLSVFANLRSIRRTGRFRVQFRIRLDPGGFTAEVIEPPTASAVPSSTQNWPLNQK